jgi:hypothetical protein
MREVERCTDVTNAVVGEADGAPCWQSERHRFGGGWRGHVLRSYCADVADGRLAAGWATRFLNFRFDSGCFVKVFVETSGYDREQDLFIRANVLRERWNRRRGASVALGYDGEAAEVVLYAFDLLMFRGKDVRLWPSSRGGRRAAVCLKESNAEVYGVINPGTDYRELR